MVNPFHTSVPFLHPLKASENQSFFDIFRGYRNGTLIRDGFMSLSFLVRTIFDHLEDLQHFFLLFTCFKNTMTMVF